VLATSAVLGLPPFSIMATAAGVLAIRVRAFCAIVLAGRALRFALVLAITAAYR
jgi:membrane protein YqaA with SNARE-associated domain